MMMMMMWRIAQAIVDSLDRSVALTGQRKTSLSCASGSRNGIDFPPCFIEDGVRINTACYIRMLDDMYLPHCTAHLATDTSSWWWQEDNVQSHISRRTKAFLKERETALGVRQFTSQLELRAMIVRTCLTSVRARGGHFEHRL